MTIEDQRALVMAHALEVREYYRNHAAKNFLNVLNMGDYGTGKTRLAMTCPLPVHIDTFDPGGCKTAELQPYIERGDIIVDAEYELDEWKNPKAYTLWKKRFEKRRKMGYFDFIGTYMLDSITTYSESVMYDIIRIGDKNKGSRMGQLPEKQDYNSQQMNMINDLGMLMSLPCHVIVNGHLQRYIDPVSGEMEVGLLAAGKAKEKIPPVFDEKYISRYLKKEGGYIIQTQTDGKYHAETRVGGGGLFKQFEQPNFKELLRKAGYNYEDKEPVFRKENV